MEGARRGIRGFAVAVLVGAALVAPACGDAGDDGQAARTEIRATFAKLQEDFAAKDARGVCASISRKAAREMGSLGHRQPSRCAFDLLQLLNWVDARGRRPRLLSTAVDGNDATITVAVGEGARTRVPFVREEGAWKLDNFFAITRPPTEDLE